MQIHIVRGLGHARLRGWGDIGYYLGRVLNLWFILCCSWDCAGALYHHYSFKRDPPKNVWPLLLLLPPLSPLLSPSIIHFHSSLWIQMKMCAEPLGLYLLLHHRLCNPFRHENVLWQNCWDCVKERQHQQAGDGRETERDFLTDSIWRVMDAYILKGQENSLACQKKKTCIVSQRCEIMQEFFFWLARLQGSGIMINNCKKIYVFPYYTQCGLDEIV